MSTLPYCIYINVFIIIEYSRQTAVLYILIELVWIFFEICAVVDYKELRDRFFHLTEKYLGYHQHDIIFISSYIKQWKIPKGFRLKFHFNIVNLEHEDTIKKCGLKLMQRTVSNYKRSILTMQTDFYKSFGKVNYFPSNNWEHLNREIEKYEKCLHQILATCWQKKYERGNTDAGESNTPTLLDNSTENQNFQKENISSKVLTKNIL